MSDAATEERRAVESKSADEAGLSGNLGTVYNGMKPGEKLSIDQLMRLGLSMGELMSALTQLEIRGFVASVPGGFYTRK